MEKAYLGDGAYAEWDGFAITITAENGVEATDAIVLEPYVFEALMKFAAQHLYSGKLRFTLSEAE